MIRVGLFSHIPLLRIAEEELAFADGMLWRMPFDVFNDWTVGAFEDHRERYEQTAPVFYRIVADLPLDPAGTRQESRRSQN